MEHIEEAGVHSGDSACSRPAHSLPKKVQDDIRTQIVKLAKALKVVGLMNTQFAVQDGKVYLLEVNPRASRTSPFVSKATRSEEHTSELQSLMRISYAVFCLKKKKPNKQTQTQTQ